LNYSGASSQIRAPGNETSGGLGVLDLNGFTLTVPRLDSIISGTDGPAQLDLSTAGSALVCNGPFSITKTATYWTYGAGTITVSGNYDNRSTSASNNAGTGTLTLTGAGPTWRQDNSNADVYNLRFNGSGTISTTTTRFGCTNQLRVSAGTLTPSVAITAVTSYLIDGGTLTWNNASSIQAAIVASSGTLNITANDTFTGTNEWSGATIGMAATTQIFSAAVAFSVGTATVTTANLTFSSTFAISSGTFGGNSAYTLNIDGNFTLSGGTLSAPSSSGVFTLAGSSNTWSGGTFTSNGGKVNWDRVGDQTDTFTTAITFVTIAASNSGTKTHTGTCPRFTTKTESGTARFGGVCYPRRHIIPAFINTDVPTIIPTFVQ
jgi:hypothetical protein